ncbi:MAG TPA: hypothetical protein VIL36_24490 [Acidimicrobiales bacterium]
MGPDTATDRRSLPRLRSAPLGRDHDIGAVVDLLATAPLVTLTGSGGIGKTTVALAVAHRLREAGTDDVAFADLSTLPPGADEGVVSLVADAAYVEGAGGRAVASLADILAHRPMLLVLDNCEHVLAGAAELVDHILERGTDARILATSRELLGVAGEHVWPLGPLHDAGPALFVERARAAEPRVAWDPADPTVVDLCRRVDDVPLAIELAAGQLRRFDLDELHRRLDDRLGLLSGRAATTGDDAGRHATMEAAIDWSYRLLDRTEQTLLRHLGVFPAPFDVGAVEGSAPPMPGVDPLAVFGQLVDKSLVVRMPGSGRYRLLEAIRVFARERLEESGEAAAAFERHRRHVLARVSSRSRLDRWMSARLAAHFCAGANDERQAFEHSLAAGAVDDAVEIALGGSFLWRNALGSDEGRRWLGELDAAEVPARDRLWVEVLRADIGQGLGDYRLMVQAAAAARGIVEAAGDDVDPVAAALAAHYLALGDLTDPDRGRASFERALAQARATGDERLALVNEAFLTVAGAAAGVLDGARERLARLHARATEDGYDRFVTNWAGWLLSLAERDPAARTWMQRQQDFLDRTGIVETWLSALSTALCDVVDGIDVTDSLDRTLILARREGYDAQADCVLVLAYREIWAERYETAAELVGTATHGRFNTTSYYVTYRAVIDRALRTHLRPDALDAATARGRGRPVAAALADHGITPPPW